MRLVKGLGLMMTAALLASCGRPDLGMGPQSGRAAFAMAYGPVSHLSVKMRSDGTAKPSTGFVAFREFASKDTPNVFEPEPQPGATVADVKVVDVGVMFENAGGFPLYRVVLDPRNLSAQEVAGWAGNVFLKSVAPASSERFAASLVVPPKADAKGLLWSDWTYCPDCFGLREAYSAASFGGHVDLSRVDRALRLAATPSGMARLDGVSMSFTPAPAVGILTGTQALHMASQAAEMVSEIRSATPKTPPASKVAATGERAPAFSKPRSAVLPVVPQSAGSAMEGGGAARYRKAMEKLLSSGSPRQELKRQCPPPKLPAGSHWSAVDAATAEVGISAFQSCGASALAKFDRKARLQEIDTIRSEEAVLAAHDHVAPSERIAVPGLSAEMASARDWLAGFEAEYRAERGAVLGAEAAASTPKAEIGVSDRPTHDMWYVARLMPNAANLTRGKHRPGCIAGERCELGGIIPLIHVVQFCGHKGGVSQTEAGWGIEIQRYHPKTKAEEEAILQGDGMSPINIHGQVDYEVMNAAVASLSKVDMVDGEPTFFAAYKPFYQVNTQAKGCRDMWVDAARHKVIENPEFPWTPPKGMDLKSLPVLP